MDTEKREDWGENLGYCTVQIFCSNEANEESSGTGFLFKLNHGTAKERILLITNKHVVEGFTKASLIFNKADSNNRPILTNHVKAEIDKRHYWWVDHPDPEVDLCALNFQVILTYLTLTGKRPYALVLTEEYIPSEKTISDLEAYEDVLIIGYPNQIWDETNNKPIFRRGVTATSYKIDYMGKPEYLVDAAIFPGSSGSPVCMYEKSFYNSGGAITAGKRLLFVGIVRGVFTNDVEGQIVVSPANTPLPNVVSSIPNNLGIVIKSRRVLDFKAVF